MSQMIRSSIVIITSILCLLNIATASEIPIYDIGKENIQLKDFTVGLIVDSNQENIDQISKIKDVELLNSRFTITSLENNYWFVFRIKNSTSKSIKKIVGFDEVFMEAADLYYQIDTGWHHEKNGLSQPMNHRGIKNRCPVFFVSLGAGETKTVYLKLHSKFSGVVGVFLEDTTQFAMEEQMRVIGYWGYFGAALAILLYNLFLLFHIRERIYLYYVINIICIILFNFLYSGYSLYLNSDVDTFYDLHVSSAVMGVFLTLFTREILKPKHQWINRVLNINIGVYVILSFLIVIDIYFYEWLLLFAIPSMLFLLFIGVYYLLKKTPLTRFYVIAMSGYLLGLFMLAAVSIGLIPFNTLTRYGFLIGSFIELLVFSLALAYRVKLLQVEKITYQNMLLATEKSIKNKLETQVQLRTKDLVNITEELQRTNIQLAQQISEKNTALNALEKSELELHESNETKDKFFSIIAHDLKSPFNVMHGFSKLLNDKFDDFTVPEQREYVSYLHQSVQQTHKLLDNLLLWSLSQKGALEFKPEIVKLNLLSAETIELLSEVASGKSIRIKDEIQEDIFLLADPNMLSTVLRNLVSNAIKFTPKGGEIVINARRLSGENKINFCEISVKDNGLGISPDTQSKLFLLGEKRLAKGTEDESGTGLGLVLCKEFVEKHDGRIWLNSELGKGSTFYFTIPTSTEYSESVSSC